ncbi:hypothetical protein Dsin_018708 [Dipteronia sinensis]|uniref:Pectinesterase n=1 Tax=Dipteronia sinensis TaxID=43782 RepID=A0AAE0A5T8_9ROSI|nr:hypothetical protein Dsin_018708 [Dipteronia sinensis]
MLSVIVILFLISDLSNASPFPSQFSKFSRQASSSSTLKIWKGAFDESVRLSMREAESGRALASNVSLSSKYKTQMHMVAGINDCIELLDDTLDLLSNIILTNNINHEDDVRTRLSAAITNQETCMESLDKYKLQVEKGIIKSMVQKLSHSITSSLALYMSTSTSNDNHFRNATWKLSSVELKLLEANIEEIQVHAVVDKHGSSGSHKTIGEAIGVAASLAGKGRTVIHITAGTYHENIKIPTKQKNVMLIGDGKGKTVIVGDRNSEDGWTTFQSATVAAMGDGFIARDITFVNSAGGDKHQAVALRVGSDKSVIFRCSILGYQDSLYTHSKRQFYRDTDIYGTVDFIFGNSAVVFQNCNIYARKPVSSGLRNFITAQGRTDPNQNTGISIHNCKIAAASDLAPSKSNFVTYLGRPWKKYSRTVVMQTYLDDLIHPSGWSPWSGNFALDSLYYGEYSNTGPGASTSGRVRWASYHSALTSTQAQAFTVAAFISGNLWLPSTGVSFDSGLLG